MKQTEDIEPVNLTPMIDIVFQMIIFFVFTVDMDKLKLSEETELGQAPHGQAVEEAAPLTVNVEISKNGTVLMGGSPMSINTLKGILRQSVKRHGQSIPVVVWGDMRTQHKNIRRVLDAIAECGLWKISLAAIQEEV